MKTSLISLTITLALLTLHSAQAETLRFIGDQIFPTGEKFKETELGGLSGLYYSNTKNTLYAISDDRSQKSPARFYEFNFSLKTDSIKVEPKNVTIFKDKALKPFEKRTIDFEGITFIGNNIYVSSEGDMNRVPQLNPELMVFNLNGEYQKSIPLPEKFLLNSEKPDSRGVRNNLSIEVLASTPDGKTFVVGNEEALLQDSSISTPTFASKTRLVFFQNNVPSAEYAYELDKVQTEPVAGLVAGETGIVDIALINDKEFYSMERSYLPLAKKNIIKIFKCKVNENTTNTLSMESLKNQKLITVEKTLLLHLDEIIPKLSKEFPSLDNIEGINFGPKLSNGNASLILVSDNNFGPNQRTVFYAFEILP